MEKTYISPEYQAQLDALADRLMSDRREQQAEVLGQLALFEAPDNG